MSACAWERVQRERVSAGEGFYKEIAITAGVCIGSPHHTSNVCDGGWEREKTDMEPQRRRKKRNRFKVKRQSDIEK